MPVKQTSERQREKDKIAREFLEFRKRCLFRQTDLAEALNISRRGVQMIENASYLPGLQTRRRFRELRQRHENGQA